MTERTGVTDQIIRDLYSARPSEFVYKGDILMHDNAPVHTAHIVRNLLEESEIIVRNWPSYFNSIENP